MNVVINGHNIYAFADTHGFHRTVQVPADADIVICAGDAVEDDLKGGEYDDFIEWFSGLKAKWKFLLRGIMNCRLSWTKRRRLKRL